MRIAIVARLGGWALVAALGGADAYAQPAPGLPRLTGIVIAGPNRVAIFDIPPGVTSSAGEGETVAAYTVRTIRSGGVQVEQDGRSFALSLSQSNQPPTQPNQAVAPVDAGGAPFGRVIHPQGPPDD